MKRTSEHNGVKLTYDLDAKKLARVKWRDLVVAADRALDACERETDETKRAELLARAVAFIGAAGTKVAASGKTNTPHSLGQVSKRAQKMIDAYKAANEGKPA